MSTRSMVHSSSLNGSRGPSPLRPAFSNVSSFKPEENLSLAEDPELHPVFHPTRVAVVTGAASGIGRAAAIELANLGLKIAIADIQEEGLASTAKLLVDIVGAANVLSIPTDVSKLEQVVHLKDKVYNEFGEVAVLLNNAAVFDKGASWSGIEEWSKTFNVNVMGVVNVQQTFVPAMLHQENSSCIINTGSKQGITNPPWNPAYNASKAAVKSLTESLAYELRERPHCNVTAHLFIPGWTVAAPTPAGAFTPKETVLYMLDRVRTGEFYVLVPDRETTREMDQLRILWGAADVVEGRPALSRWHPTWKSIFEEYMRDGLKTMESA